MMLLRIFWALFLAGFTAYTFHHAWKLEHGAPMPETLLSDESPRTKETVVWVNPSFLPLLWLVIFILFGAMGGADGIERFLSLSLNVMIVISVYFLLLFFLLPIFRRYFSARACATMWILPVFMFWQAHILIQNAPVPAFVIYIPLHILKVLFFIWFTGFVVVYAGKFISHFMFRQRVMSVSYPVRDPEVLELFDQELKKLEYYAPVSLVISPFVTVPLSMGVRKRNRVTVLPDRDFTKPELQFIFRHEIHHLQRGDVSTKIFFAFCQALCWFNPLIWMATRKASDDLELSCDEIVLEEMDASKRKQYAKLLLDTAGHSKGFTTCLSATAKTLRYRLKNVVTIRRRRSGTILLSLLMFLCVMSYGTIAVSNTKGTVADLITEDCTAADIDSIIYQEDGDTRLLKLSSWNKEKLFSHLTSLKVEKLGSANELHDLNGQSIVIAKNGMIQVTFYDRFVEVRYFLESGQPEYFYLRTKPDWDIIKGYHT